MNQCSPDTDQIHRSTRGAGQQLWGENWSNASIRVRLSDLAWSITFLWLLSTVANLDKVATIKWEREGKWKVEMGKTFAHNSVLTKCDRVRQPLNSGSCTNLMGHATALLPALACVRFFTRVGCSIYCLLHVTTEIVRKKGNTLLPRLFHWGAPEQGSCYSSAEVYTRTRLVLHHGFPSMGAFPSKCATSVYVMWRRPGWK